MKRFAALVVFGLLMGFSALSGMAEEARDITKNVRIHVNQNGNDRHRLTDGRYKTVWNGGEGGWMECTMPSEPCYGLYMHWGETPGAYVIEAEDLAGEWTPVTGTLSALYYNDYIAVPGLMHFRVRALEGQTLAVGEMQFLSQGDLPDWVQRWQPFEGKADLLLLAAHPDDEVLWFGGMIPTYRGERGLKVLVALASEQTAVRRSELLDCLWACGVREYPVVSGGAGFLDRYSSKVRDIYAMWGGEERLLQYVTGLLRRYQPDVVVTHDLNGEYGHGAHKACALAMTKAIGLAADESYRIPGSDDAPWQVQKLYLHLYPENAVTFDWRQPLAAFDGKTGFEVAEEAFRWHKTQQTGKYAVKDTGRTACNRFGLYFSLVGPDEIGNDLFEHLPQGITE